MSARTLVLALLLAACLAACGPAGHPVPVPQPGTEAVAGGWPCCAHCCFCTEDEPLHGEPCDEPGCQEAARG